MKSVVNKAIGNRVGHNASPTKRANHLLPLAVHVERERELEQQAAAFYRAAGRHERKEAPALGAINAVTLPRIEEAVGIALGLRTV